MTNFTLSNAVDKDKIFLVNLSEIDERLFYKAVERIKNDISKKSKFGYIDLIKTCKIKRGRYGRNKYFDNFSVIKESNN